MYLSYFPYLLSFRSIFFHIWGYCTNCNSVWLQFKTWIILGSKKNSVMFNPVPRQSCTFVGDLCSILTTEYLVCSGIFTIFLAHFMKLRIIPYPFFKFEWKEFSCMLFLRLSYSDFWKLQMPMSSLCPR